MSFLCRGRTRDGIWETGDYLEGLYGEPYIATKGRTPIPVIPGTVGRYFAKGKNGDIFEGDIIKHGGPLYVVKYGEFRPVSVYEALEFTDGRFPHKFPLVGFYCEIVGTDGELLLPVNHDYVVVGNIFDNLELTGGVG